MSIVYILLSLYVALDDISAYYLSVCGMTTLLLLDFMLSVDVGHTYIPLSPTTQSRSTLFLLLCLMFSWRLVAPYLLFDLASD